MWLWFYNLCQELSPRGPGCSLVTWTRATQRPRFWTQHTRPTDQGLLPSQLEASASLLALTCKGVWLCSLFNYLSGSFFWLNVPVRCR